MFYIEILIFFFFFKVKCFKYETKGTNRWWQVSHWVVLSTDLFKLLIHSGTRSLNRWIVFKNRSLNQWLARFVQKTYIFIQWRRTVVYFLEMHNGFLWLCLQLLSLAKTNAKQKLDNTVSEILLRYIIT